MRVSVNVKGFEDLRKKVMDHNDKERFHKIMCFPLASSYQNNEEMQKLQMKST